MVSYSLDYIVANGAWEQHFFFSFTSSVTIISGQYVGISTVTTARVPIVNFKVSVGGR